VLFLTVAFLFQLFDELIFEGGDIHFAFFEHRLGGCGGGGLTGGSLGHCLVGRVVVVVSRGVYLFRKNIFPEIQDKNPNFPRS